MIGFSQTLSDQNLNTIKKQSTSQIRSYNMFQALIDSLHLGISTSALHQGPNTLTTDLSFNGASNVNFGTSTAVSSFNVNSVGNVVFNTNVDGVGSFQIGQTRKFSAFNVAVKGNISLYTQLDDASFQISALNTANTKRTVMRLSDGATVDGFVVSGGASGLTNYLQITNAGLFTLSLGGTNATGDSYFRDGSGNFVRRAIGSSGQVYTVSGGLPTWSTLSGILSGLTTTRVPFAASSTTLTDDATYTWDNTNKALTINSARIISKTTKGFFFGNGAGNFTAITTADGFNTGFGYQTQAALTDGANFYDASYNTSLGYQALKANTIASFTTAIGYLALAGETATSGSTYGWYNTAIGAKAGQVSNNSIGGNTWVGGLAGRQSSTGYYNTSIGYNSGGETTGSHNAWLGWNAGASCQTCSYNAVFGSEAGESLTSGSTGNVMMGYIAGVYATGSGNVLLGQNSGGYAKGLSRPLVTGSGNTFVGTQTGLSTTGGAVSLSTALGYDAEVASDKTMIFGSDSAVWRPNYGFGGESFGGGRGVIFVAKVNLMPTSAPTGGFQIYSDSTTGAAWIRNPTGSAFAVGSGGGASFPLSSSQLVINNPAATFAYTFTAAAIAANRTITLPLLAGNDVMVTADFAQTLTNKVLGTAVTVATATTGSNTTKVANEAFVQQEIAANLSATPLGAASGGTGIANNAASTITISGNFGTTFTVTGTTSVTFPTSGTLTTTAAVSAAYLPLTLAATTVVTTTSSNLLYLGTGDTYYEVDDDLSMAIGSGKNLSIAIASGGGYAKFSDSRATTVGIEYNADYSAGFSTRSLVDKAYVDGTILNNQTGTTYTFVLADVGKLVTGSNGSAITMTVPPNASVAYPAGARIRVKQKGAGQITIAPGAAVTLHSANGLKTLAQYSYIELIQTDTLDTWDVIGSTTP